MASQTVEQRIEAERKQDVAWRLYMAGASFGEIASSRDPDRDGPLYANGTGAAHAIRAARKRHADEDELAQDRDKWTAEMIRTDLATLKRLKRAIWPAAAAGSVAAVREIRQITMAAATLAGYVKGQNMDELPKAGDPVDDLAKKRDARRAAGS
jgi:hypothetical protein